LDLRQVRLNGYPTTALWAETVDDVDALVLLDSEPGRYEPSGAVGFLKRRLLERRGLMLEDAELTARRLAALRGTSEPTLGLGAAARAAVLPREATALSACARGWREIPRTPHTGGSRG